MAKITNGKLKEIKDRILHEGSYLELEAFNLQLPEEELRYAIMKSCNGGAKSSEFKAILRNSEVTASRIPKEELEKIRILPKPRKRKDTSVTVEERTSAKEILDKDTVLNEEENIMDPMNKLVQENVELEKELDASCHNLEKVKGMLDIRIEAAQKAKSALQRAQAIAENAEADVVCAQLAVKEAKKRLVDVQEALKEVSANIEELKANTIWLIDPWYSGEMPGYGTCFSVVERELVTVQQVETDYLPEATLEGVLLFDYVPDYKKAREFCGLVTKYELENKKYKTCISDERVKALIKMYVG